VAHTAEERIAKKQLSEAVEIYARMVSKLLAEGQFPAEGKARS
jgi:acetylornithine deacetylase/succinyl-diaminopimelate desuccinylase-like protein